MRAVTDATFEREVLEASGPVLVDFWAEWCPPCRMLEPVLEQLDAELPGLTIVKVNADDHPELAVRYRAMALPTMTLFSGGEVVKTILGAKPKPALEAELAAFL